MRTLLFLALLAAPARAGDVEGTVTLPEAKKPPKKDNRYPGGANAAPYKRGHAIVFIDGVEGKFEPPKDKPKMEQKDRQFTPLALAVVKGTTVEFPNGDDEYHNVISRSTAKELDLGRYNKGESREITFDKPGIVRLRCEIHSTMHAVIVVVENPYFAVCDENGKFTIKGVPPGKYKIYAFHEDFEPKDKGADPLRTIVKEIEVVKDGTVKVDLDMKEK